MKIKPGENKILLLSEYYIIGICNQRLHISLSATKPEKITQNYINKNTVWPWLKHVSS